LPPSTPSTSTSCFSPFLRFREDTPLSLNSCAIARVATLNGLCGARSRGTKKRIGQVVRLRKRGESMKARPDREVNRLAARGAFAICEQRGPASISVFTRDPIRRIMMTSLPGLHRAQRVIDKLRGTCQPNASLAGSEAEAEAGSLAQSGSSQRDLVSNLLSRTAEQCSVCACRQPSPRLPGATHCQWCPEVGQVAGHDGMTTAAGGPRTPGPLPALHLRLRRGPDTSTPFNCSVAVFNMARKDPGTCSRLADTSRHHLPIRHPRPGGRWRLRTFTWLQASTRHAHFDVPLEH
jgi:hypothetical protein